MMKHPKALSRLENKVAVVTGASDGIGVETARFLADLGATVVMPARNATKARAVRDDIARSTGNDRVEVMEMDLSSLASVRAFAKALAEKHPKVDVLVLNAGVWTTSRETTVDGFEKTMGVNHFGHFALTIALIPLLEAAGKSRVVVVSSKLHLNGQINLDDIHYEKGFASGMMSGVYADSKLANALFAVELAERVKSKGITVNFLHPGVVSTSLAREMGPIQRWFAKTFFITPEKGAHTSVYVAASPDLEGVTGRYYDACKEAKPNAKVSDAALRKRLWTLSEELTKTSLPA